MNEYLLERLLEGRIACCCDNVYQRATAIQELLSRGATFSEIVRNLVKHPEREMDFLYIGKTRLNGGGFLTLYNRILDREVHSFAEIFNNDDAGDQLNAAPVSSLFDLWEGST